jgi:hypothetical protein
MLQNIEAAIVSVFRAHPELSDHQAEKAVEGLIRLYQARVRERPAPELNLGQLDQKVYDAVKTMCDWRSGDAPLGNMQMDPEDAKTPEEIIACLKRIRKSINFWTRENGRQGYLTYVDGFIV